MWVHYGRVEMWYMDGWMEHATDADERRRVASRGDKNETEKKPPERECTKKTLRALDGVRTRDLPLTKGTPYHLATKAHFCSDARRRRLDVVVTRCNAVLRTKSAVFSYKMRPRRLGAARLRAIVEHAHHAMQTTDRGARPCRPIDPSSVCARRANECGRLNESDDGVRVGAIVG